MTATTTQPTTAPAALGAPIPFTRLLRVEWGKATDTRAARWLIGLTALATTLVMLLPLLAAHSIEQTHSSYLQVAATALTVLLPVVSILTLTSEWTQRTVLTTFTQQPRRTRVIGAKVSVSLIMGVVAASFCALVTAASIAIAEVSGRHVTANLTAATIAGFVAYVLVYMLTGVAFGALLHNTAVAISLYFVLPTAFAMIGLALNPVRNWIDPGTTFNWMLLGQWHAHLAPIALTALIWLVIPLSAGLLRTARREIK